MSKYMIKQQTIYTGEVKNVIINNEIGPYAYFCGYDSMGSVEWRSDILSAYYMDIDEAAQIIKDLEAADEPAEPETKRENVGYEIIQSIRLDAKHEIVIGKHPTAPASYVCWDCTNGNDYNNGGYCMTFRQALLVLAERIHNRYDFLPVEY